MQASGVHLRRLATVAFAVAGVAVTGLIALALFGGQDDAATNATTSPLDESSRLLYHEDDSGHLEGYELVKDGRILLMLWDTDHNGELDRIEYYLNGESEILVKDRNGDHKVDWWQLRTAPEEGTLARDDDCDGVVDEESQIRFVTKY